jgi:GNAT superfamily N-acetyltransferase
MNTTIDLRRYSSKDLAQTVRLWRASKWDAFPYVEVWQHYTLAEDRVYFWAIVAVECVVWLAEVEGHRARPLAIKDDYIDQLLVAVELQRQGVSTALLQKARERPPVLVGKRRGAPHSCGISGRATKARWP